MKEKCLVLLSNGLDSRLALKLMKDRGYDVTAVHFKLPFSKDVEKEIKAFTKNHKTKLKIFDCTKGKLLQEYLETIKNAKYGRGAGVNPCVDCKIFMLEKAKEFANGKKIKFIATGEVPNQRPMSQTKGSMRFIEKKSGLDDKIIRPLSEIGISGRRRDKQINLAKKFKIDYPHPAGGCILCEKELRNRLRYLLGRGMDENEVKLVNSGRHFLIKGHWIVLGRDERECKVIEKVGRKTGILIEPDFIGPSALVLPAHSHSQVDKELEEKVNGLIKAYSKKGGLEERDKFEKYKL